MIITIQWKHALNFFSLITKKYDVWYSSKYKQTDMNGKSTTNLNMRILQPTVQPWCHHYAERHQNSTVLQWNNLRVQLHNMELKGQSARF